MHSRLFGRFLLSEQGSEGNGTTATDEKGGKAPDLNAIVASLITKHGSEPEALRFMVNENYKYRDRLRDVTAKLPPEGSVVLMGDDAKAWDGYRSLGKLDDVRKATKDLPDVSARLARFERSAHVAKVAEAATIAGKPVSAKVLETLTENRPDLRFDVKPVKGKDGKDVPTATVWHKGDDGKDVETTLEAFASEHWKEFLPALAPAAQATARPTGTPPRGVVEGESAQPVATEPPKRPALTRF